MPARNVTSGPWKIPPTNRPKTAPKLLLLVSLVLSSCARPVDPPQRVFSQTETLLESQLYKEAAALARQHLAKHPRSARLHMALGRAELSQNHFKESSAALEEALRYGWKGMFLYSALGINYFYLGRLEEAQRWLERTINLEGSYQEGAKILGYIHYYLGDGKRAVETFERLHERDPKDLEVTTALDALKALTGQYRSAQMTWLTDPESGLQLAIPGGWEKKTKKFLGPAGTISLTRFSGPIFGEEGRFGAPHVLFLTVHQNAGLHPLPEQLKGPYRPGEKTKEGGQIRYATAPRASPRYQTPSRDPAEMAKRLTRDSLQLSFDAWDLSVRDFSVAPWVGIRGRATYCLGGITGEDRYGRSVVGYSLGFYDPSSDVLGMVALFGPTSEGKRVEQLSKAISQLALFGGLIGIPPFPRTFISPEEYQARIQGFLQANQPDRALTEVLEALQTYPANPEFHFLSGKAHLSLWHIDEARQDLEKAKGLGLSRRELEFALGELYLVLGEPVLAEQAFSRALALRPADPNALMRCGMAAYRQGDLDKALAFFRQASAEAPSLEEPRAYKQAIEAFLQGGRNDYFRWYQVPGESDLFCVPAGWAMYELKKEKNLLQVLFSRDLLALPSEDFDVGLLYTRYEKAASRVGRIAGDPTPEEVVENFARQTFDRLHDPQKIISLASPIFRRGIDRFLTIDYAYTEGSRRRVMRMLSYYEENKDRLHVLTFRVTGEDMGEWEPVAQACLNAARFGR